VFRETKKTCETGNPKRSQGANLKFKDLATAVQLITVLALNKCKFFVDMERPALMQNFKSLHTPHNTLKNQNYFIVTLHALNILTIIKSNILAISDLLGGKERQGEMWRTLSKMLLDASGISINFHIVVNSTGGHRKFFSRIR
jgi:hypothetical protein